MLKASVIFELSIKVKKNWHCLMYTSFKIWKLPTFTFFQNISIQTHLPENKFDIPPHFNMKDTT